MNINQKQTQKGSAMRAIIKRWRDEAIVQVSIQNWTKQVDKTLHVLRASIFSKLPLIFHGKFSLKGKYLETSASISASRPN